MAVERMITVSSKPARKATPAMTAPWFPVLLVTSRSSPIATTHHAHGVGGVRSTLLFTVVVPFCP